MLSKKTLKIILNISTAMIFGSISGMSMKYSNSIHSLIRYLMYSIYFAMPLLFFCYVLICLYYTFLILS